MQQRLQGVLNGVLEKWNGLERGQKIKFIITTLALVITLGVIVFMLTRPEMVVIHRNLDRAMAGEIQNALNEEGIYSEITQNGTVIQVRAQDQDATYITLSEKNITNGENFNFETAFKFMGMGTTEKVKNEVLLKLHESKIADSIKKFPGVKDATVHLSIPEIDRYFLPNKTEATASISINTPNKELSKNEALALARFVAKSVSGLKMENIEIINQNFEEVYSGTTELEASPTNQLELENLRKREIASTIKKMLSPRFDNVEIMTKLALSWDTSSKTSKSYKPSNPESEVGLPLNERITKRTASGTDPSAEPGIGANDNTSPSYQAGDNSGFSANDSETSRDFIYNEEIVDTKNSVGDVDYDNSSIAVVVYRLKVIDEQYLRDQKLLVDQTWEDYKASQPKETEITIEPTLVNALRAGTGISNIEVSGYEIPIFVDRVVTPLQIQELIMFGLCALLILLLVYGLIKKTQPDEITEIEPELSVEELLVSNKLEEQKEADMLKDIDFNKESEAKKQIEKFVYEKPEAVAALLRNWLNDEWGE